VFINGDKMSHYFENDKNLKSDLQVIKVSILNTDFTFSTDSGVFSKKGLDFGTRTLLESLSPLKGNILDLGCGYGPIGIILSKLNEIKVDMIDINERSVELAKRNADKNKVNVNIVSSDGFDNIKKEYDYIISNPPIRIGKEKMYQLLIDALKHLKKDGELWIVINKEQGAKSLINDFEVEYTVEVVNKNKGFYIIKLKNH